MKWEYYGIYNPTLEELNWAGGLEWELVTNRDSWFYFKRPLDTMPISGAVQSKRPVGRPKK